MVKIMNKNNQLTKNLLICGDNLKALDDLLGLQGAFCAGGIETSNGRDDYARRRIDALVEYINRK